MSVNKTVTLEAKTKGFDEAEKQIEDVSKATKVARDSVEGLNQTFEQVYGELQPLTTRMGEAEDRLYELALAGDTTSQEYQQLLEKVGQYRQVQIETDLAVDQAAKTMSQKLGAALTGAASGFTAATGLITLMGSESEELNQTLLKVNAAMAFQQGVEGIREYTKSIGLAGKITKVFNLILKGNPLTLIATTLIAVIGYFAVFTDAIGVAIQALKDFGDWIGLTNFAEEKLEEDRKKRHEEEVKRQKEEAKQLKERLARLKTFQESQEAILEAQGKKQLARDRKRARLKEEANQALIDGEIAVFNQIQAALIQIDNQEKEIYKDRVKRRLDAARQIEDLEIEIMEDAMKKELRQNQVKFDRLIEDTKKNTEINAKERKRLIELFLFQQQEAENEIRNRFRREELDAEENQIESLQDLVKEKDKLTLEQLKEQADKEIQITKDKIKAKEELEKRNREFALNSATQGLDVISSFAQQSADKFADLNQQVLDNENLTDKQKEKMLDKNNKRAKKAFNVQKAANIATALITTYQSATSAYASQFLPVPDPTSPVRGGIAAGLAVAAGLANVANISKQKFEGASLGSSQSASGDVGGGAQAPQFNVVGDSGVNQLAQLQQQPTQAFVVSGEVTTAQALDRNRVQNATL